MPRARAQLRASQNMTRLAKYSTELFQSLESITGQATGYQQTGSITLALNGEREAELRRQATMANAFDVVCEWVEPDFIANQWPGITLSDARGEVYLPGDGQTNPIDTTLALARGQGRKARSSSRTVKSPSWSSLTVP